MGGPDVGGETSQTMDRGLALLEELARAGRSDGMTVTELATALGVGRPVVYRLAASLARRDLVHRLPDGRVRLGLGLLRLAEAALPPAVDAALPVLRELADAVGATAHLTVAESGQARALAVVEPASCDLHLAYRVGSRHPLQIGAAGRALLAGDALGPDDEPPLVGSSGELQPGAHGLAAPVPGVPGLRASVGVVALTPLDPAREGAAVLAAARRLRAQLG